MTRSPEKAESNRRNASLSTGPRTPNGKAASSLNARRHGILSREVLIPGEAEEDLQAFEEGLRSALRPVGDLEELLVDRIVSTAWRLRRLVRVESGIFSTGEDLYRTPAEVGTVAGLFAAAAASLRDREAADEEEGPRAPINGTSLPEDEVEAPDPAPEARAFVLDALKADSFGKLSKYETTLERSLYRALHELERFQAARNGQVVPPPVAVDVDVNVAFTDSRTPAEEIRTVEAEVREEAEKGLTEDRLPLAYPTLCEEKRPSE